MIKYIYMHTKDNQLNVKNNASLENRSVCMLDNTPETAYT